MTTNQATILDCLRQQFEYLQTQFHVKKIALFGSFATETATTTSDIDLVIEFEQPIGLKFVDLCDYLEHCLGRKVDVLTMTGIKTMRNRSIAENILRSLIDV
jgi:predicted nucleotidyltransferase